MSIKHLFVSLKPDPKDTSEVKPSDWNAEHVFDGNVDLVILPNTISFDTGVIYKGADRFIHDFIAAGASGLNTFVGIGAGNFTMAISGQVYHASYNTGVGRDTLACLTTGYANAGFGYQALWKNTSGISNTAIGCESMLLHTTGNDNTAVGYNSLSHSLIGHDNVAFGNYALGELTDGYLNVAVGGHSLRKNISGYKSVGIGTYALYENTGSIYNVAVGHEAGNGAVGANFTGSTLIGYRAGFSLSTGINNVLIGYNTGISLSTGYNNIIIGYSIDSPANNTSNYLSIGDVIYGNLSTKCIGIGTNFPNLPVEVEGTKGGPATSGIIPAGFARFGDKAYGPGLYIGGHYGSPYGLWIQGSDIGDLAINYPISLNPNGGNVGIGTVSPLAKLHEYHGTTYASGDGIRSEGYYPNFQFYSTYPDAAQRNWAIISPWNTIGALEFKVSSAQYGDPINAGITRFIIQSNGNVGIGTVSPGSKLSVVGLPGATAGLGPGDIWVDAAAGNVLKIV